MATTLHRDSWDQYVAITEKGAGDLRAEIERLTAENGRMRADVAAFVAAWDSLPVGDHSVRAVQDWLNSPALKSSVLGLKAFQQQTVNSDEGK